MKEKDRIDDNLVARRVDDQGDSEKGIRLNVTSPLALSAQFIRLAEAGKLKEISPLVEEHQKVAKRLVLIESKLLACNSPEYLAEFEQYCRSRNRDFPLQLKTVARRKEVQKIKLRKRLASLEKRLLRNKPWLAEWLTSAASETVASAVSLVPTRNPDSDPDIIRRNKMIVENRNLSAFRICEKLDFEFSRRDQPPLGLPLSWVSDFGVANFVAAYRNQDCRGRVQKLISSTKASPKPYLNY